MADIEQVTSSLYAMSREIAQMEAEAYELKQRALFSSEVKSVLDSWVRHEASVREREQKSLVQSVIDNITKRVGDKDFQTAYLNQCLMDVEAMAKKI